MVIPGLLRSDRPGQAVIGQNADMSEKVKCPITGGLADVYEPCQTEGYGKRIQYTDGWICISEKTLTHFDDLALIRNDINISLTDVERTWALLTSIRWRLVKRDRTAYIFIMMAEEFDNWHTTKGGKPEKWEDVVGYTLESLIADGQRLTFRDKLTETLENLVEVWVDQGVLPILPGSTGYSEDGKKKVRFSDKGDSIPGYIHGATKRECPLILQSLFDDELIGTPPGNDSFDLQITPRAFREYDDRRIATQKVPRGGFFVRRSGEQLDEFYRPLLDAIASNLNCKIEAVWERPHNEKIDDRILRLIREAAVVLADISGLDNFNVGMELGYALALGKEIVLFCEDQGKDNTGKDLNVLPFDIRTMNCYFYKKSEPELLQLILSERVREGLLVYGMKRRHYYS